ncbi:MAG: hypothetical protein ABIC82_05170 [bacterium]
MITNNAATSSVMRATYTLWDKLMWLIPSLLVAIFVVLIGWMIASILGSAVEKILNKLQINKAADSLGISKGLSELSLGSNISKFAGLTVKWFIAIAFFLAASDILQLTQVTDFLNKVLLYIPNIIAAILILAAGVLLANVVSKVIHKSAKVSGFVSPDLLSKIAKWSILIFAMLASLVQLGVAKNLIETLFTGFVVMLALAGGLAFGLGGKEKAKDVLDKIIK